MNFFIFLFFFAPKYDLKNLHTQYERNIFVDYKTIYVNEHIPHTTKLSKSLDYIWHLINNKFTILP